jgi:hypothetical protein
MELKWLRNPDGSAMNMALTTRHLAMLRAVAAGRAELTCSRIPDLYVDGRCCTDHTASALLITAGLIDGATDNRATDNRATDRGRGIPTTGRVPARLTPAGTALLAELTAQADAVGESAA